MLQVKRQTLPSWKFSQMLLMSLEMVNFIIYVELEKVEFLRMLLNQMEEYLVL